MNIQQHTHGAVKVVQPVGPVSQSDADQLRDVLMEVWSESLGRLVLDAKSVPFIDSRGLEALLHINEELSASGQSLKICGLTETLRDALELTDLARSFELYEDVGAAVRSFL